MSTQIKRLQLGGTEFAPITLAEAVVVKTENLPGIGQIATITTLDKVLNNILGLYSLSIEDINELLANKLDKIKWGNGFYIDENTGEVHLAISTELYEIVSDIYSVTNPENNKIYLVRMLEDGINKFNEFIYTNGDWEQIGQIDTDPDINLDDYLTKVEFLAFALETITAVDVTTTNGVPVKVSYDFNEYSYDAAVSDGNDYIEGRFV